MREKSEKELLHEVVICLYGIIAVLILILVAVVRG